MNCSLEHRDAVESAALGLQEAVPTEAVDVLPPSQSQYGRWTLDAVVTGRDGIPAEVLRELALAGLTLRPAPNRGEFVSVVATA